MAIGNAAPGGRQREITELFRFKKPNSNEQSTHATGEPVPPAVPQSSIPTATENDKIDDSAAAAGLGDRGNNSDVTSQVLAKPAL
jgi:hypothetical protein